MKRRVVILGATGSIGRQTCDIVARFPDHFEIAGVVAGQDVAGLADIATRFRVPAVAVVDPPDALTVPDGWLVGRDAACEVAAAEADVVVVAITGAAALLPTLAAIDRGRDIALATKEVLVMAGGLVTAAAARSGARLVPVDSEHSALWQCLRGEDPATISRLILTASGGAFRDFDVARLQTVGVAEALAHPNWSMGPKVTVDSATMMNKGLEIIEAHHLFDIPFDRIEVAVHPPSLVHSMVEFCDGATMAQIGIPDMRIPIALAINDGRRLPGICPAADLRDAQPLEFRAVDPRRFPAVDLARSAGVAGGSAPAVLNAANEEAVAAFLAGDIPFLQIVPLVERALSANTLPAPQGIDDVIAADDWARRHTRDAVSATSSRS